MENTNNNLSAPKTVSADTKIAMPVVNNKTLALPFEPKNLEDLRFHLGVITDLSPSELFECLVEDKDICSKEMLKEMFKLDERKYKKVFLEGRLKHQRDFSCSRRAWVILDSEYEFDENYRPIQVDLSPAQKKLRELLARRSKWGRFGYILDEIEEDFESDILYEIELDVYEECSISEEELLDALQTYQAEHRA
jgi:hypothetical protein